MNKTLKEYTEYIINHFSDSILDEDDELLCKIHEFESCSIIEFVVNIKDYTVAEFSDGYMIEHLHELYNESNADFISFGENAFYIVKDKNMKLWSNPEVDLRHVFEYILQQGMWLLD